MSRLVLDEPIAGSKYRLVLDEPVKFRLVPDEPSDKPKPSLFKKTVREYSAQLADLLKVPSALTGLPHLPMESELATETIPHIAGTIVEKVTTPIGTFSIPQLGTKYTKSGIPLPKITSGEISPTPLDIGFMATLGIFGIKDVSQRIRFNNILSKQLNLPKQGMDKAASDLKLNTLKFVALKAKEAGRPLSAEFLQKHLGEKLAPRYNPRLYAAELAKRVEGKTAVITKPLSLSAPVTKAPTAVAPVIPPISVAQLPPSIVPIVPIPKAITPIAQPTAPGPVASPQPAGVGEVSLPASIQQAKAAGQSFDEWVKRQGVEEVIGYRYGYAPESGRSYNTREKIYEKGVSLASGFGKKEQWSFAIGESAANRKKVYYKGKRVGFGGDDEYLISDVKEINKGEYERLLKTPGVLGQKLKEQTQKLENFESIRRQGWSPHNTEYGEKKIIEMKEDILKTRSQLKAEWDKVITEGEGKVLENIITLPTLPPATKSPLIIKAEQAPTKTPVAKGKEIFYNYTRTDEGSQYTPVEGKAIKIPGFEKYDFFVYKAERGKWQVSEARTGMLVSSASAMTKNTQKEAIDTAISKLKTYQKEIDSFVEKGIKEHGISPKYAQQEISKKQAEQSIKDYYKEEMETSGTFAKEPSRPREIDVTHIAKTPEEWKKTIEQLNKFGQMQSILRRTGGISKKRAVGQFVRPGKGKLTKRVLPTGEVRLRSEYIEPPFNYASVLAHELGHALEWNLLKSINKETFKVFGDDLTLDIIAKIKDELIAVTKALEGEAVVSGNPRYYLQKTELLARFMQKMIESPGNLGEIAPTAWDNFQKQAIKHPIIGEFLEAMRETIDKGQTKFYILPDLREMHLSQLGKRAGELAYGDVLAYQALKERAKTVLERFLNTKFKGIKDSPELLFNAAESIKVTKSGQPEFGTRDFQIAKNEQEKISLQESGWELTGERIEDGIKYPLYAKARYTPEEAEDFFTQLSPEGQALIKEFTAQKDEAKDLFNREVLKATYKIEGDI